jgi:type I restriction enzyme S subunit
VLTPGNFAIGGGIQLREGKERYYHGSYPAEFDLRPGDLLVAMTDLTQGAPILGSPIMIPADGRQYLHNQRLGKIEVDPERLDLLFAYYMFVWDGVRAQLRASATGATVRHTAPERIGRVLIALPPLATQRKIAAVLSAFDELSENNTRRIKLLDETGQRIYREWFVEYRYPGHDGRSGPGAGGSPSDCASWRERDLRELGTITMGQSPPSSAYNTTGDGLPFHQGVGTFGEHFPVLSKYSRLGDRIAEPGDVLLSVRAPVGRINVADRKMILGRGLCGVRGVEAPTLFLLHALKQVFREEDSMGGGAIFNAVTRKDVECIPIPWPGRDLVDAFADRVGETTALIANLTRAKSVLRECRELLLPRLISGELDPTYLDISGVEAAA